MHEAGELVSHRGGGGNQRDRDDDSSVRTAYVSTLSRIGIDISQGKRRVTGQGLCPPKDRKR